MRLIALGVVVLALVAGSARAAQEPVQTRTQAVLELQAAIVDEQRALALLRKDPPRRDTASLVLARSRDRLAAIRTFLSGVPGAGGVEELVGDLWLTDVRARDAVGRYEEDAAIKLLEQALVRKRTALGHVRTAKPPPAVRQCSDGRDNDGDGITDWTLEPGCTSARDVRESTRFSCGVEAGVAAGRLALTGSCSGAFAELELTLLDGLQLNGRFDIEHAPSCSPPTVTRIRCTAKNGAQNPAHLVDVRLATTMREPGQRVQLRFFDARKRQLARFAVPVR